MHLSSHVMSFAKGVYVDIVSRVIEHIHEKSSNNSEKEAESEGQQYKLPPEYSEWKHKDHN